MGFAAHMSSLRDEDRETKELNALVAQPHMYKVPSALVNLPARKSALTTSRHASTDTAHGHAHGELHYHDHGAVHPYHVLPPSPWPLLASWSTGVACLGMAGWFHSIPGGGALMAMGIANVAMSATCWWRDCIIESDMGMHTEVVKRNLVSGVWMFIVSEAVLFFGLLWSCIHLGMAPTVHVQMQWPPVGVIPVGWDKRALVMSAVLAASYYSANVAMVAKDPRGAVLYWHFVDIVWIAVYGIIYVGQY
ncbi:MAG: hypothetical protein WDW38_009655 [Sanguina aurantia]